MVDALAFAVMTFARLLVWLLAFIVPGGLVVLASYCLARALHDAWLRSDGAPGVHRLRRALSTVRVRDVVRQAGPR